jgi:hypothetical protein
MKNRLMVVVVATTTALLINGMIMAGRAIHATANTIMTIHPAVTELVRWEAAATTAEMKITDTVDMVNARNIASTSADIVMRRITGKEHDQGGMMCAIQRERLSVDVPSDVGPRVLTFAAATL